VHAFDLAGPAHAIPIRWSFNKTRVFSSGTLLAEGAAFSRSFPMETSARIGPSIHIKGEVTSHEPLIISGHVDGTITVEGHGLTIDSSGSVDADIAAEMIVVEGMVNGSLTAGTRIVIRSSATVEGDALAPSVSVADGATIQGRVETAKRQAKVLSLAS
jgi:cytoskeletal protein CcmA (bactofilin family)